MCVTLAFAASGCTYIPGRALEEQRAAIDEDGDGSPGGYLGRGADCDDSNPAIFPGADEIPYDGLDNDCDKADILDFDGDGYPGISKGDYELVLAALQQPEEDKLKWPDNLPTSADLVDCRDDQSQIYPNNADRRYDGIDSNCGGDNDFDDDNDGFMPDFIFNEGGEKIDVPALFQQYVEEWGYAGRFAEDYGDCDDEDALVSPGTTEADIPYDGVDQDCSGDNDFDVDGDGWMPFGYELAFDTFISRYPYTRDDNPFLDDAFGDCLDEADLAKAPDPAEVNPGMVEVYGDGVDADCDGANDFDADGDGYMPDGSTAAFVAYLESWSYSYPEHEPTPREGDCNDSDARVFPGALETIADGTDQDCNGDDDTTTLMFADLGWTGPRSPAIVRNERHYVVAALADEFQPVRCMSETCEDSTNWYQAGAALFFDPYEQSSAPEPSEVPSVFQGSLNEVTAGSLGSELDMGVSDGEAWAAVAYTLVSGVMERSWIEASLFDFSLRYDEYLPGRSEFTNTTTIFEAADLDLVIDSGGEPWIVACGTELGGDGRPVVQLLRGVEGDSVKTLVETEIVIPEEDAYLPVTQCYFRSDTVTSTGIIEVCGEQEGGPDRFNRCLAYTYGPLLGTLDLLDEDEQPEWFDRAPYAEVDYDDGWHIFLTDIGTVDVYGPTASWMDVLGGETIVTAEVASVGSEVYIVALTADAEVLLAHGDPEAELERVVLPVERDGVVVTPTGVSVFADEDRLVVAITAGDASDDTMYHGLGWAFFGL
jgi:hypothetical protein